MKQKQTTAGQMKVNLDNVWNPNPKLLQTYTEKNAMDLFTQFEKLRPQYVLEDRLFKIEKLSKKGIKHHIGGIYRRAIGSQEYLIWHEHLMTYDFYNNPVDHTRFMGRWEKPQIITRFSIPTSIRSDIGELKANEMPPEVNGSEVIYDFEFTSMKNQLQEWYNEKIITDGETKFYYWNDEGKIPVRSFDEFLNCSGDDLILLGRSASKLSGVFKGEERAAMLESLRAQIKEEMKESGFFNKK